MNEFRRNQRQILHTFNNGAVFLWYLINSFISRSACEIAHRFSKKNNARFCEIESSILSFSYFCIRLLLMSQTLSVCVREFSILYAHRCANRMISDRPCKWSFHMNVSLLRMRWWWAHTVFKTNSIWIIAANLCVGVYHFQFNAWLFVYFLFTHSINFCLFLTLIYLYM